MANVPYEGVATVQPDATVNIPYYQPHVSPDMFGAGIGRGLQEVGAGAVKASQFYGQVNAQDVMNRAQQDVDGLLHGVPGRMVQQPDGSMAPDTGFLGTHKIDAVNAYSDFQNRSRAIFDNYKQMVQTPEGKLDFDRWSQSYRTYLMRAAGQHYETQFNAYSQDTNNAHAQLTQTAIANNAYSDEEFTRRLEDMKSAYVKQAQLNGAGPEGLTVAAQKATQDAWKTRLETIAVKDPAHAAQLVEAHKAELGKLYPQLAGQFKGGADQQNSLTAADAAIARARSQTDSESSGDAAAMLRHFEGFRAQPYWDVNHWRVGYGSDTITRADGSVVPVTAFSRVSLEDAERDLARRVSSTQRDVRGVIGDAAWQRLTPNAQASITSVAYNYGHLPQSVAAAASSGDSAAISSAISALRGANGGVNAKRRDQEAQAAGFSLSGAAISNGPAQTYRMPGDNGGVQNFAPPPYVGEVSPLFSVYTNAVRDVQNNPQLSGDERDIAIAHVRQQVGNQGEAIRKAISDDESSILSTGQPLFNLTRDHVAYTLGENAAREFEGNRTAAQNYYQKTKDWDSLPAGEIQSRVDALAPTPGAQGYDYAQKLQADAQKRADAIIKKRYDDPAGAVDQLPTVQKAKQEAQATRSYLPLVEARLAAQRSLGIPEGALSPITDDEAQRYAALLRPVSKGQAAVANQEQAINSVVADLHKDFGPYTQAALSRVLYHVTMKSDAADVLASAIERYQTQQAGALVTPQDAQKVQVERDAQRAAAMSGNAPPAPRPQVPTNGKLKPFWAAVDLLRSDPGKLMPDFIKRFGVESVPYDLRDHIEDATQKPGQQQKGSAQKTGKTQSND